MGKFRCSTKASRAVHKARNLGHCKTRVSVGKHTKVTIGTKGIHTSIKAGPVTYKPGSGRYSIKTPIDNVRYYGRTKRHNSNNTNDNITYYQTEDTTLIKDIFYMFYKPWFMIVAVTLLLMIMSIFTGCENSETKTTVKYEPNTIQQMFSEITDDMHYQEIFNLCNEYIELEDGEYVGKKDKYGHFYLDYETDTYTISVSERLSNHISVTISDKNTSEYIHATYDWDYSKRGYHTEAKYSNETDGYSIWLFSEYDGENGPSYYHYSVFDDNFSYGGPEKRFDEDVEFSHPDKAFQYVYDNIY